MKNVLVWSDHERCNRWGNAIEHTAWNERIDLNGHLLRVQCPQCGQGGRSEPPLADE